ncbi:MAG: potassium/proton antiporter [Candidatus Omnitrophota bacterium]
MNEYILVGASILVLISVLVSKISDRFGIPALLLFLLLGILAGSEGIGGVYFDEPALAQFIGIIALAFILFSGGLSTDWEHTSTVIREGLILSTFGVLLTAVIVGLFVNAFFNFSLTEGLLLGAIVSSTDAAAVFSVLRSKGINLKGNLIALLEMESGSNDPMAIFLTIGLIRLLGQPDLPPLTLVRLFIQQMAIGAVIGYGMGRVMLYLIKGLKLSYEGLYSVLTVSLVLLMFGLTNIVGGSGFLAVYLAGMVLGKHPFMHKKIVLRFHDGLAWMMQIAIFLLLGLLVFPSRLVPVIGMGLLIAGGLIFIARPVSVFISLFQSPLHWREKVFISWVGLRGAAPIILATFPLLAGLQKADLIFNVIFFVVLASVLLQGTSIPFVARWLKVDAPVRLKKIYPIEYTPMNGFKSQLKELSIPLDSEIVGKTIGELDLPNGFLIILLVRENDFLLPRGNQTVLQGGDTLLVLSDKASFEDVLKKFNLYER